MNISYNLINISSKQSLKHAEIQNWTDLLRCKLGTGSLSMFCMAPVPFIKRNTVYAFILY